MCRYPTKTAAAPLVSLPGTQIATEFAFDGARQRMAGPEFVEQRFVLAARVGMELSGHVLRS